MKSSISLLVVSLAEAVAHSVLDWAYDRRLNKAYLTRMAVVPTIKVRDVTPEDHARIYAAHDEVDKRTWLGSVRDALCVELQLMPEQVTSVLGARTRRQNGNSAPEPEAEPDGNPPPPPTPLIITIDPATWPRRSTTGDMNSEPTKKEVEVLDDLDRKIILMVARDCHGDPVRWTQMRKRINTIRRLNGQQAPGVVAAEKRRCKKARIPFVS